MIEERISKRISQLEAERKQVIEQILANHPQVVGYTCAIAELTLLLPKDALAAELAALPVDHT